MMNEKQILALVISAKVVEEVLHIVVSEYPEIVARAIIKVVEDNPETFKGDKK